MSSSNSRGNYYKKKTQKWYEDQGYTVELTEFVCARQIPGRIIYKKVDILASDGIAYNEKEFILWNAKSTNMGHVSWLKSTGSKDYRNINTPPFIKKQLVIWEPRKKPVVVDVD